jgi:predicted Zn finger-like uncharacterized protein
MLVRCPSCKTTYKVADELLSGTSPVFRCSRCKHTFEIDGPEASEKTVPDAPPLQSQNNQTDKEEELSFSFPSETAEAGEPNNRPETPSAAPSSAPAIEAKPATQHPASEADPLSSPPPKETPAQAPPISDSAASRAANAQPVSGSQEAADKVFVMDPYRDQPASIVPYLTLFALLIILFGLLTAFQQLHPAASEKVVKQIPLLGTSVLKNNHLKSGVTLHSLRAGYQTIQGNREVFIITGVAHNLNPVVIRDVRVAGHIYNQEGAEIEQQRIWIGNAISPKIIRGMTIQDIADLQRLKPLKTFDIPPGDSVPFTIVFLKASKGVQNFGCEVLSAEAEI